jgi:4-methyl-5(b-hydroxyethyl)-thiazole monophosphate biosynthesis
VPSAIIILADGFEEIEAITCIDILRRAEMDVAVLGLNEVEVRGSRNIMVKADLLFDDYNGQFDAVVLPGGIPGTNNLAQSQGLLTLIKEANQIGKICAAICAAPTVLAKAGILTGKKATCYPGHEGRLSGAQIVNEPVVTDGNIITSRAVGTTIPFALKLVEALAGEEIAKKISSAILYSSSQ